MKIQPKNKVYPKMYLKIFNNFAWILNQVQRQLNDKVKNEEIPGGVKIPRTTARYHHNSVHRESPSFLQGKYISIFVFLYSILYKFYIQTIIAVDLFYVYTYIYPFKFSFTISKSWSIYTGSLTSWFNSQIKIFKHTK